MKNLLTIIKYDPTIVECFRASLSLSLSFSLSNSVYLLLSFFLSLALSQRQRDREKDTERQRQLYFSLTSIPANSDGSRAPLRKSSGARTPRTVTSVRPQSVGVVRHVVALLRQTVRPGKSSVVVVVVVDGKVVRGIEGQPLHARARGRRFEGKFGRTSRQKFDPISGAGDERDGQAAVEVVGSGLVDLEDSVERFQEAGCVGRSALPYPVDEDSFFVEAVGHAEAEVLVDVVFEQRHLVDFNRY